MPAVQQQVRTHARQSRGRRRSAAGVELPAVPGSEACSACGTAVPRSELMYGSHGAVCTPCFSEAEDHLADRDQAWLKEAGWAVARAAGLLGVALAITWITAAAWNERPMGVEQATAWFTFFSPTLLIGGGLTLQALREARTRWVLPDGPSGAFAVHALSAGITLLATLLLVGLSLLPVVS